jgi:hypothetical protein
MRSVGVWLSAAAIALSAPLTAKAAVVLDFPSPTSTLNCAGAPSGPLGAGGGGVCFNSGDNLVQTFAGTGLPTTTSSEWQFSMTDVTAAGIHNTFQLLINSIEVGTFSFDGSDDTEIEQTHVFDITFASAPIAGDTYTLEILATSTVPSSFGSWNWLPGGNVTLSAAVAVPEPCAFTLLGSALAMLGCFGAAQVLSTRPST